MGRKDWVRVREGIGRLEKRWRRGCSDLKERNGLIGTADGKGRLGNAVLVYGEALHVATENRQVRSRHFGALIQR